MRVRPFLRRLVLLAMAAIPAPAALAQTETAVEFRHVSWGYYFITASPGEAAYLDAGAFNGDWKRTGQTFTVRTQAAPGIYPACRFFSTTFQPKSSHFYTPDAPECEYVKLNPNWQYESIAFYLALPDANGHCAAGTNPLYRLYNNGMGGAPNHRYASTQALYDATLAAGWTPEGHPQTHVFACVPPTPASDSAVGMWVGTTDAGDPVRGFVLDDHSYWFVVSSKAGDPQRVLQGSATTTAGAFSSADGKDFPITTPGAPGQTYSVTIGGTFVSKASLQLTITGGPVHSITATHATYDPVADVAAAAGSFVGHTGHASGAYASTFSIDVSGGLVGQNAVCQYFAAMVPGGEAGAFDFTLTGNSGICVTGNGVPRYGLAYFDAASHLFYGFVLMDGRGDCYHVVGTK